MGITVTLTQSGNVTWQSQPANGGSDTAMGTDANNTFAQIADMTGVIYYGDVGWWVELTFTGLDPNIEYTFATSANRGNPLYIDRWTIYTINDADTYTNASTSGVDVLAENKVRLMTGDNYNDGFVARWTGIRAADGNFTVRAEADPNSADGYKAYSFDVFMLEQESSDTWRDSGDTENGLAAGSHTVEYSTVSGWNKPANETVQINGGETTTTTGTYTQQTGYLQVTVSPPGAVTAGAKWRVDGGAWRDSDYTESGLTVGSHTVEYSVVSGWNKPSDETVQINDGQTTTTTGTYTQQTGSLQVTISPPGAVTAGAQWRVDGGTWRDSGYTESGLTVGSHTVEYSTVTGWNKPADETVQINDGQTTITSNTYTQQSGYLQVTISPPRVLSLPGRSGVSMAGHGETVTI
jgi:hypothetical protein